MKKIINYEKDILFKTNISEICSISLEHDFTVDDGYLRGDFIVSGEYKTNELSINKEPFNYKLPLEYELEKNVDLQTLTYDIENFEYNVSGDELSVYIDFGVRYEEKLNNEPVIPEIVEEEINNEETEFFDDPSMVDELKVDDIELPRLNEEEKNIVMDNTSNDDNNYITYHVHIVREGESLETISNKYNVTCEQIKEYNQFDNLEIKSKLIIPEYKND